MAQRALVIEVRLLTGRYHGVGDWPPSPFRLFQALVAGAYGGRWITENREDKDAAFRWLERLTPPCVVAPPHARGRVVHTFVPNNDIDAVGGDVRRVSEVRAQKQTQPFVVAEHHPFIYAWAFDDDDTGPADVICRLAERLHTFGRGVDSAFALSRTADWETTVDRLRQIGTVLFPNPSVAPDPDVRCPSPGSFESLIRRYARWSGRLDRASDASASTLFRQPPRSRCAVVSYDRSPARYVFDLLPSEESSKFRALPQVRAVDITTAVRDLAYLRLARAMPGRAAELEQVLIGRGTPPTDPQRRVRFVPLPSRGARHADAAIRRILVEVPPDCPFAPADIVWALAGQSLEPFMVIEREAGELRLDALLVPSEDETMLVHFGLSRAARRWRSMTPVALPRGHRPARLGSARAASENELAGAVLDALRHAGLPSRGVQVRTQREAFSRHGASAPAFASGRFSAGGLHHVEVVFPKGIQGPVVIGDGRWLGLGVMAPVWESPPSVHIYRVSGGRWPVSEVPLMTQALRRAVMARAGALSGPRRQIPVFFTGHEGTSAPVRGLYHGHLFYFAHDADGDGLLDLMAIVAPHLADRRTVGAASAPDRRLLARAVDGLQVVRAGRLGVLELTRVDVAPDDLFGMAAVWESASPYRPTRHPRRGGAADVALVADLKTECARRGLPQADVSLLDVLTGPRGGLQCRARLTFATGVQGPLLLGAGSHFGEGLFRTVPG
jgi:CRISPR-associated protein Csb2